MIPILEVCANSAASALAAQEGGAARVELCAGMPEGGTTPSHGEIVLTRQRLRISLNVIIRPRGGDFLYDDLEFEIMQADIRQCRALGVDGVVFGILKADGGVDVERCRQLVELARPLSVTFHRAFDMACDPFLALEEVIACGADRLLSSGQRATAEEGIPLLAELVKRAGDRIIVMPGAGVSEKNVAKIARETGAKEFHASGRGSRPSGMVFRNPHVSMGGTVVLNEYERSLTDAGRVRRYIQALEELS